MRLIMTSPSCFLFFNFKAWIIASWSSTGGSKDAFTLAVGHKERDTDVLDCIREVWPPFSPELVVYDFSETLKRYSVSKVVGDRYSGDWPKEQFHKYGITYDQSAAAKSYLYQNLLPVINSQSVSLLDNTRLIDQLVSLERKTSSTKDRIDHPPNGHNDHNSPTPSRQIFIENITRPNIPKPSKKSSIFLRKQPAFPAIETASKKGFRSHRSLRAYR